MFEESNESYISPIVSAMTVSITQEAGMRHGFRTPHRSFLLGLMLAALPGLSSTVAAQDTSQPEAVQASLLPPVLFGISLPGTTTVLASTPSLPPGIEDALESSMVAGNVPTLLSADSLHAAVIGLPDRATSEASLGSLGMFVAGNTISADFVMARAASGAAPTGLSEIDGLVINGTPITPTGARSQIVPILGGVAILNEQQTGASGVAVTALHVIVNGVADVLVASVSAAAP